MRLVVVTDRLDVDPLQPFFARFSFAVRVVFAGQLCRNSDFDASEGVGHVHVLRGGELTVTDADGQRTKLDSPSVIFFPGPATHRLWASEASRPDLVCAAIEFGATSGNPLTRALPPVLVVPLADAPSLTPTIELLFGEARGAAPGRTIALDRLSEYFVLLLFRHALATSRIGAGLLAGLADARLAAVLGEMHAAPERAWTLESLASRAGMSRARFAAHFRTIVGEAPLEYLTDFRICAAQALLRRGKPLKIVAPAVGYASTVTLARAFARRVGTTPSEWLQAARSKW